LRLFHPRKLTYLYQKFNFIAIFKWATPCLKDIFCLSHSYTILYREDSSHTYSCKEIISFSSKKTLGTVINHASLSIGSISYKVSTFSVSSNCAEFVLCLRSSKTSTPDRRFPYYGGEIEGFLNRKVFKPESPVNGG